MIKNKPICIWFTGLSGSGKSTTAEQLYDHLKTNTTYTIKLLDGDVLRQSISQDLGYDQASRLTHHLRIADYIKQQDQTDIALVATIAPYQEIRRQIKSVLEPSFHFVQVYMDTPLDVCENRDPKGLYLKARAGLITHFTGLDDPYEIPVNPELILSTTTNNLNENVGKIVNLIQGIWATSSSTDM